MSYFGSLRLSIFTCSPRSTLSLPALFTPSLPSLGYLYTHLSPLPHCKSCKGRVLLILALPASALVVWAVTVVCGQEAPHGQQWFTPPEHSLNVDDAFKHENCNPFLFYRHFILDWQWVLSLPSKDLFAYKGKRPSDVTWAKADCAPRQGRAPHM